MSRLELKMKILGRDVRVKLKKVAQTLNSYGNFVTRTARAILKSEGKNATGNLSASIQHKVVVDKKGNTSVVWDMEGAPYWAFVEKGVKGAMSANKAPDSPFQFGSGSGAPGGLRPAIRQWIVDKPVGQWRDLKTGRFMSYDGMAFMISRNVYLHGIAPTPFLEPTVKAQYRRYKKLIENAYAKDIGTAIGTILEDEASKIVVEYELIGK